MPEQRLNVDISVTNRRRWLSIWAIEIEDHVEREGGADAADTKLDVSVTFPRIAGRQSGQLAYRGRLERRGRYRFGPLRVSTRFPLGLARHSS